MTLMQFRTHYQRAGAVLTFSLALALPVAAQNNTSARAASAPSVSTSSAPAMTTESNAPLFYRQLVPFDAQTHGRLALPAAAPDYRFAAHANVIPLVAGEVAVALKYYPIVFVNAGDGGKGAVPKLSVLVGAGDGHNLYVEADGQWRAQTYIPAYVRRYPFHVLRVQGRDEAMLGIDIAAPWINAGGSPLFEADGKPSARLEQLRAFAQDFHHQGEVTETLVKQLQEAGVLEASGLSIAPQGGGEPRQIGGFMVVSPAKLHALDATTVYRLHQSGALALAHGQLLSLSNLNVLNPVTSSAEPSKSAKSKNKSVK